MLVFYVFNYEGSLDLLHNFVELVFGNMLLCGRFSVLCHCVPLCVCYLGDFLTHSCYNGGYTL